MRRSADPSAERAWHTAVVGQLVLAGAQLPVGAWVGLSGAVPASHPGADATGGWSRAVADATGWALTGAPGIVRAHAWLALATAVLGIGLAVQAARVGGVLRIGLSVVAAAAVVGAGVCGSSSLVRGGGGRVVSLLMVALFTLEVAVYLLGLVLPRRPQPGWGRRSVRFTR